MIIVSDFTVQKWRFPLRISSVNVIKSVGNCEFGHIYWKNPKWKTSFFVQCSTCIEWFSAFFVYKNIFSTVMKAFLATYEN